MNNMATSDNNIYVNIYKEIKRKRKQYLATLYTQIDRSNVPLKRNHIKYAKPWYMMTKGKLYMYNVDKKQFGLEWDFHKVPSETKIANLNIAVHALTRKQLIHKLIEHKEKKWVAKNPCPVDIHGRDLFKKEFLDRWKKEHAYALKDIHDFVNYAYNKTCVLGRFVTDDGYVEREIGKLKISTGEVHCLYDSVDSERKEQKYEKDARKIMAQYDKALVCIKLLDLNSTVRRIYVPAA